MRRPAEGNPLERFTRSTRNMVKKHPWLSLVVGGIWLANTLVCLVVVGVWLLGGWPGIPGAELATTPALIPTSLAVADQAPTEPAP